MTLVSGMTVGAEPLRASAVVEWGYERRHNWPLRAAATDHDERARIADDESVGGARSCRDHASPSLADS